jgi:RNA polymerase II subunit A small phosphatase-like protein
VERSDFTIQVEIDNIHHTVFVLKRPYVEQFLEAVAKNYELVVFTASLSKVGI